MASSPSIPAPTSPDEEPVAEVALSAEDAELEQALIPTHHMPESEPGLKLEGAIAHLPVELDVAIPVREFRVRHLLALEPGTIIETRWSSGEDMPLTAGIVQLAWSEFEVIESQLAVRITRLS